MTSMPAVISTRAGRAGGFQALVAAAFLAPQVRLADPAPSAWPAPSVAKTVELVGKSDPQAYAQIMLYQVERSLNHPACHGPTDPSKMATLIQQAVEKVRAAEQTALAGTSLQATPVLASASFDYELIR